MNKALKIIKVGNSTGMLLPKDLLARLRVSVGDELYVSDADDGVRLTANNPDFERAMKMAEDIMRADRDILRVLAQ